MLKKTSELKPNKFNDSIYGKEDLPDSFITDIKKTVSLFLFP